MFKKFIPLILIIALFTSCQQSNHYLNIIPVPESIQLNKQHFKLNNNTKIYHDINSKVSLSFINYCANELRNQTSLALEIDNKNSKDHVIIFTLLENKDLNNEEYQIDINQKNIVISAVSETGLFYGFQSLRQLIPQNTNKTKRPRVQWKIPGAHIQDSPRFSWRGMQLDVARHFIPKDVIKRYIDILAYFKMNILHLHLCDDQGWRIEIKKYPKLTEKAAWRTEKDGSIYGGYYTQEDIKDIVEYAQERHISIIPEIEMPGHATALLSVFPQISCTEEPVEVSNSWGIHDLTICPGKDSSYIVLQNILSEIIELFPSHYIHLGGDEIKYDHWDHCYDCQALIENKIVHTNYQLQHYFFSKMAEFLEKHDKNMIGWEEIIRGSLPKNSIVQVWKNERIINSSAFIKHRVIVSLYHNSYFHRSVYQTPLHEVYENPIIPEGFDKERAKYVLGGECCLWTEYITPETIDSFAFPRLIAYSEVMWSQPQNKNFTLFYKRLNYHQEKLNIYDISYGPEAEPISIKSNFDPNLRKCFVSLNTSHKDISIHYCYSDKKPYYYSNTYDRPLVFSDGGELTALSYVGTLPYGEPLHWKHINHLALGIEPMLRNMYSAKYNAGGIYGLTDGIKGSLNYLDGTWQGYKSKDLYATIDLGEIKQIKSISVSFLHNPNVWIFAPKQVNFYISDNGIDFKKVARFNAKTPEQLNRIVIEDFNKDFEELKSRYVKVIAVGHKNCPSWHPSGGKHAWLFTDEIIIQ